MIRSISTLSLLLAGFGVPVLSAVAASFDCAKATTPFEKAICGDPDLSRADERLSLTYATAIGGLSENAVAAMRSGQRDWLSYAQRACTRDAKPLTTGTYDERGISCLNEVFSDRSTVLETSRMIGGWRFYPETRYDAMPDPYEADNPDSYYPVARHELAMPILDSAEEFAIKFNALVRSQGQEASPVLADDAADRLSEEDDGSSSDTTNTIMVEEVAGSGRITLKSNTYWYGHGAAHGNWGVNYLHYLVPQQRWVEASDVFAGKGWKKALLDLTLEAAQAQHGDNLMLDGDTSYVADAVADPARWELSDPYALVIQFQPYEISAYAYGAPEVRVSWDALDSYLAETAYSVRYGN